MRGCSYVLLQLPKMNGLLFFFLNIIFYHPCRISRIWSYLLSSSVMTRFKIDVSTITPFDSIRPKKPNLRALCLIRCPSNLTRNAGFMPGQVMSGAGNRIKASCRMSDYKIEKRIWQGRSR
jgi:hypothetical protein